MVILNAPSPQSSPSGERKMIGIESPSPQRERVKGEGEGDFQTKKTVS